MVALTLKEQVLRCFSARPKQRLTPKEIHKRLRLPAIQLVVDALRDLAKQGRLVRLKKNHYALPGRGSFVTGKVHAHPDGFGFLIPEERGREDLYLNRREMRRTMHGDRVMVRVETNRRGGGEAHIVQVLDRAQSRLIGTYEEIEGRGVLIPMDARIGPAVQLAQTGAAPDRGKIIAAEISRYGTAVSPPKAELQEILGDPDDPEVHARSIIFRYGLPTAFAPDARGEAASCTRNIDSAELLVRKDLRGLPTVTIDGETARDFDDAVSIERVNGLFRLYVSIADVAHYVRPNTGLDREAYLRGTSIYFPDRAIPMLPEELSNGICSLNPHEERLTQTVLLEIDAKGGIVKTEFFKSVVRSWARMTYTEVRRILADRDRECIERRGELVERFKLMEELALILWERRKNRGTLDFDLPEAEIILDLQGLPEKIVQAERSIAHRMIEEFMIAANEAVARHLKEKGSPLLYRVHEGPDHEKLEALAPFLLSLGYRLPLKKGKVEPKELQKLLEACHGKPEEKVVNRVLLRAMKQARYSPDNTGHFGLASTCYTHFTSPIRRYPDLIVHRMLEEILKGRKLKPKEVDQLRSYLEEAGKHTSERERIAMDAEREMVDLKKAQFMMDKIGQEFPGFIVSLANFGFFVQLENYFVEGLVKLSSLTDDAYRYYEKEYVIKGLRHGRKFRLGDSIRVKVARINAFRSEIDFQWVNDRV